MRHPGVDPLIKRMELMDNGPTSDCGFDMDHTAETRHCSTHPCGSACCIGGHAALMLIEKAGTDLHIADWLAEQTYGVEPGAALAELCSIPLRDAGLICWPGRVYRILYSKVTLEDALRVLRTYRDTGVVDWKEVIDRQYAADMQQSDDGGAE